MSVGRAKPVEVHAGHCPSRAGLPVAEGPAGRCDGSCRSQVTQRCWPWGSALSTFSGRRAARGKGGEPGQTESKIHGPLKPFSARRHLGGREPAISHTNLALQPEEAGKTIPALGPGIRGCPHSTKSAGTAAGLLSLSLPGGDMWASQLTQALPGGDRYGGGEGEDTSLPSGCARAWEPKRLFSRGLGGKCLDNGVHMGQYACALGSVHWGKVG